MLHVAVFPPSSVVTVIVAVPAATGETTPPETVTIALLLLVHDTFWFVAFVGAIVAVSVAVAPPTTKPRLVVLRLTLVTETIFAVTVTAHVAVLLPSTVVTEMVAAPVEMAVTTPPVTVAMDLSELVQVTVLSVAVVGATVAVKVACPAITRERVGLFKLTPVTETVLPVGVVPLDGFEHEKKTEPINSRIAGMNHRVFTFGLGIMNLAAIMYPFGLTKQGQGGLVHFFAEAFKVDLCHCNG